MDRPKQIQPHHLEKLAIIYPRQSTMEQVRDNTGSKEFQLRLTERALQWGWPESRIVVIDDDLGVSGSPRGRRPGFGRMMDLMRRDEVAIVLASEASRLSRNPLDAEEFLWTAIRHKVLVEIGGKLFSPGDDDLAELLTQRAQNLFAWFEVATAKRRFDNGKREKLRNGHAVTHPPVGFVMPVKGKWMLDPESAVPESIRRVFPLYLELRGTQRVARYLRARGLLLPRRCRTGKIADGRIIWEPASQLRVARILRDPNYTDALVYYRTKRVAAGDKLKVRVQPQSEWSIYRNHHPGLVTWEDWQRIQEVMDGNRRTNRPPILHGAALLEGLLWCGQCKRRVKVVYDRRIKGRYFPAYCCSEKRGETLVRFHRVPTERLDTVVVKVVLAALAAPSRSDLRAVLDAYRDEQERIRRTRGAQLAMAEAKVAEAKRRYLAIDPELDLARADLGVDYQTALNERDRMKREQAGCSPQAAPPLGDAELDELVALSTRIEALWRGEATTNQDRKWLLHAVVARVEVQEYTEEWIDLKIVWVGGLEETHRVVRSKGIDEAVAELRGAGYTDARVAEQLHGRGVIARGGGRVCRAVIAKRVARLGIQHEVTWRAGLLRIRELLELGWSSRQILEELKTNGPRHYHNRWTRQIVQQAAWKLRTGLGPLHGVPPLPGPPRKRENVKEVWMLLLRRRAEGRPWQAIADELNAKGYQGLTGRPFTRLGCASMYCSRRLKGTLPEAPPAEVSGKVDATSGQRWHVR